MEARKTCYRVLRTSIWLILYYEELCKKKLYRPDFRDVDRLKRVLLLLGPISQMRLKGARQMLKRVVMVFRVYNRHVELLSTY